MRQVVRVAMWQAWNDYDDKHDASASFPTVAWAYAEKQLRSMLRAEERATRVQRHGHLIEATECDDPTDAMVDTISVLTMVALDKHGALILRHTFAGQSLKATDRKRLSRCLARIRQAHQP